MSLQLASGKRWVSQLVDQCLEPLLSFKNQFMQSVDQNHLNTDERFLSKMLQAKSYMRNTKVFKLKLKSYQCIIGGDN